LDRRLITLRTGIDFAECILKNFNGRQGIRRYVVFLVQIAHFETKMVSTFSYSEIAVSAILLTFGDSSIIPHSMLSKRTTEAAIMLQRLAERKGIVLPLPDLNSNLLDLVAPLHASPTNVDTTVNRATA
jgi:hypothetical protein